MYRRSALVGLAGIASTIAAGCIGVLTGSEPISFEASPVGVDSDVAADAGYEHRSVEPVVVEQAFEAAGQTRTVEVTNYRSQYEKSLDLGLLGEREIAVFTVLSTPRVSVLDREFNPVADMSTEELAEMVQENYDGIDDVRHESDGDVTILGESTTQSRFAGTADFGGTRIDIYLHISEAVESGENLVVTVGAYPRVAPGEAERVLALMAGVEPAEPEA